VTASAVSRGSKECKEEKLEVLVLFDKGGQWRLALGTNGGNPETWGESHLFAQRLWPHKGFGEKLRAGGGKLVKVGGK